MLGKHNFFGKHNFLGNIIVNRIKFKPENNEYIDVLKLKKLQWYANSTPQKLN